LAKRRKLDIERGVERQLRCQDHKQAGAIRAATHTRAQQKEAKIKQNTRNYRPPQKKQKKKHN
jgi:hypothetical protein